MARPYTFEPDVALDAAMQVFWRDGYELARLSELQRQMGIQRGSLYQEFGSKKELFLKAFRRYIQLHLDPALALLTSEGPSNSDRIRRFFEAIPKDEPRGCLLCNTAAGAAGTDIDLRTAVSAQLNRLRDAFEVALTTAIEDPAERRTEAYRLTQTYIGKRVEARVAG